MKINTILNNFVAGELSPRLAGRTDIMQYYQSAAELLNMIVEFYGGAKKAPGTYFANEVKNSSLATRLVRFVFSDTQAYILEFGNLYIRFYMNGGAVLETAKNITSINIATSTITSVGHGFTNGQEIYIADIVGTTELNGRRFLVAGAAANTFTLTDIDSNPIDMTGYAAYVSGGTASRVYTLTTTYTTADLWKLQFAQTADILYITLGNSTDATKGRPQKKLTRTAHTSWTITDIDYSTGYARPALMDTNVTATTITPSADAGAGITLTASAAIFDATHVGSVWRVKDGYVKIIAVAAGGLKTAATGNVLYGISLATGPAATDDWAEGAWSGYRGYPKAVTISEGRLQYGYTVSQPQTVWGSEIGAYETFEKGALAADAIEFPADTNQVEVINWLFPANEILVGTPSGVSSLGTGSDTLALTASTGRVKKKSAYGVSEVPPQIIGNNVFYWQKYNRTLREYAVNEKSFEYEAFDATVLSDHITKSGIVDMAYQQSPLNILWCVRADGKLCAFTRQIEQKVSAWTLHDTQGFYESVAVIPKESYDEVWFVVRRTVNGVTRRYIEYMVAPEFEEIEDAFFVHSGLTYDTPYTITGISKANPALVLCVNDFADGDIIKIRGVEGMTEVNYKKYIVANRGPASFTLKDLTGADINSLAYSAYASGGEARKCVNTVSNLSHLEGKTVQVLADGASHPDRVVSGGAITLDDYYSQVTAGLGYTGRLKSNDLAMSRKPEQGNIKRVSEAIVNLYESLGCKVGDGITQDDVIFRTSGMPTDAPPELFTGLKTVAFPSGFDNSKQVVISQEQCLPLHVLSISLKMEIN